MKISAVFSVVSILTIFTTPADCFSLTKCKSSSKCLVVSCKTGLEAIKIADLLSQNNFTGVNPIIPKSKNNLITHITSQVTAPKALYSASVEDLETVGCFLLFQDITLLPKNKQKPVTDFLVKRHLPQSESTYPLKDKFSDLLNCIPLPGQDFKYLNSLKAIFK